MRTQWLLGPTAVVALLAFAGPIEAQSAKWRAVSILEGGDSKNCGATKYTKFDVEMNDSLLMAKAASGTAITFRLQSALNPDGSGKVVGLNDKNRPSTFEFAAGTGPRQVKMTPPYSTCVWTWQPLT